MTAGDSTNAHSLPAEERDLARRLLAVLAFLFVFTAVFAFLDRVYSQKFLDITGDAKWIWAQHRMSDGTPVAFFATRDFDLPERRVFTHLKVLGDPVYTVYVNGQEVAGRAVGEDRALDLYDLGERVRTGRNRVVIAVRAPQGVGGLIASIDIGPEATNWIVTDGSWRIYRRWTPSLLHSNPMSGWEAPAILGEPPEGRWNYLSQQKRALDVRSFVATPPRSTFELVGLIPGISTRGGVAVAISEKKRATVFDFGHVEGQLRLTLRSPHIISRAVPVRFANHSDELGRAEAVHRHVVFAPGEQSVVIPETYSFRYAMVFAREVDAALLKEAPASRD